MTAKPRMKFGGKCNFIWLVILIPVQCDKRESISWRADVSRDDPDPAWERAFQPFSPGFHAWSFNSIWPCFLQPFGHLCCRLYRKGVTWVESWGRISHWISILALWHILLLKPSCSEMMAFVCTDNGNFDCFLASSSIPYLLFIWCQSCVYRAGNFTVSGNYMLIYITQKFQGNKRAQDVFGIASACWISWLLQLNLKKLCDNAFIRFGFWFTHELLKIILPLFSVLLWAHRYSVEVLEMLWQWRSQKWPIELVTRNVWNIHASPELFYVRQKK